MAPGHTRCGIKRRAGSAAIMQASVVARYGITLIPKQCSRNTTANGFAPRSACQRAAPPIINVWRGQPKRRGSSGLVEG